MGVPASWAWPRQEAWVSGLRAGPRAQGSETRPGLGLCLLWCLLQPPSSPLPSILSANSPPHAEKASLLGGSCGDSGPHLQTLSRRPPSLTVLHPQAQSLALLTTVAMPVFSKKNETVSGRS